MTWTPDRIGTLRELWPTGASAARIAAELGGGFTRNSVIGKAARLGLVKPGQERRSEPKPRPSRANATAPATVSLVAPTERLEAPSEVSAITAVTSTPSTADDKLNTSQPCTLLELSACRCRWPLGDPRMLAFRFCGGDCEPERSYCPEHREMARSSASLVSLRAPSGDATPHLRGSSRMLDEEAA